MYADAFPIFLNYYPSSKILRVPADGPVAYAPRAELAEATANLMMRGGFVNETLLLTGPRALTYMDLVETINDVTGRDIVIKVGVPFDEYVKANAANDEGGKPESFFQNLSSWYEGIAKGDGETVDPMLEGLLGRIPKDGKEVVRDLLSADPAYTWHQNYMTK